MSHVGYLVAGYGITALAVGAYAWRTLVRERALRQRLSRDDHQ